MTSYRIRKRAGYNGQPGSWLARAWRLWLITGDSKRHKQFPKWVTRKRDAAVFSKQEAAVAFVLECDLDNEPGFEQAGWSKAIGVEIVEDDK